MTSTFWVKQTSDKPAFADLLWSRPENRAQAGKLLIIGGNLHGFAAPAEAYSEASKAGIGTARVLLPDALKKTVGSVLENGEFSASTPSGSFAQKSLVDWLDFASWSDAILVAGDLGRNSETAILLEKFVTKRQGQLTITKDGVDYFKDLPQLVLKRPQTTLVLSFAQLQKLATQARYHVPFTFSMSLLQLVDTLHEFTKIYPTNIVVKHLENMVVASQGKISTTKLDTDLEVWRVKTAASCAVWWLQNPEKPFEALATAIYTNQKVDF